MEFEDFTGFNAKQQEKASPQSELSLTVFYCKGSCADARARVKGARMKTEWNQVLPDYIHATIHTDGSCPSNPGPMGIGYVIRFADAHENERDTVCGTRFGDGTNNQAEYLALIFALRHALRIGVTHVSVFSDSQLIVQQVNDRWACKDGRLKPLLVEAQGLLRMFVSWTLNHIPREDNSDADYLSKNPTDTDRHATDLEINLVGKRVRKLTRNQAALVRWWWKTHRCQNEGRLARLFGATPSHMGRIGRGEQYQDITPLDLPGELSCPTNPKPSEASSTSC